LFNIYTKIKFSLNLEIDKITQFKKKKIGIQWRQNENIGTKLRLIKQWHLLIVTC